MVEPGVKVLGKAARIIRILRDEPGLNVVAIALRLGEPRPTVYRLVQDLLTIGFVEEAPLRERTAYGLNCPALGPR